jgi:hypothetical protein
MIATNFIQSLECSYGSAAVQETKQWFKKSFVDGSGLAFRKRIQEAIKSQTPLSDEDAVYLKHCVQVVANRYDPAEIAVGASRVVLQRCLIN